MKFELVLFFVCSFSFSVFCEDLRIEVKLDQGAGREVFLAGYYLGNIYVKDTIQLDSKGRGVFLIDSLLPQGLYKIFMDKNNHFDFLLGADQQFLLAGNSFSIRNMQVEGAPETAAFFDYLVFLNNLRNKRADLNEKMKSVPVNEKNKIQEELATLTSQLHEYWNKIGAMHPDWFLAKFVKANYVDPLDVSALPRDMQNNDSLVMRARFYYQRTHFWDHFDFTDERFLYTPFFKPKLEKWFTQVLYQQYDSVKPYVLNFIEKVRPQKRIFQFVTSFFLNSAVNSNVMGMDALFVDLARKYYLSGEAYWASEKTIEEVRENVLFAENNLIGMKAPDLTLEGFDEEYFTLYEIDANYTLVVIYEPNCSHCKVFVPNLYSEVYVPFRDKGLEVYAIYSMDNKTEWGDFLTSHDLFDWINVWDEHHVSRFKILYDARKTPLLYLLDKNKKIVAKKLTVDQVKALLEAKLN